MGNNITYLRKPITNIHCENGKGDTFVYAVATVQGWRKKQEDKFHAAFQFHLDFDYFAVFDGHGGSEIAEFLRRRLHEEIKCFIDEHGDIELALHQGFLSCDLSLRDPENMEELNEIIKKENDPVGRILKSPASADELEEGGPSGENSKAEGGKHMDIELFTDPIDDSTGAGPSETQAPHSTSPVGAPPESDALQCLLNDQLLPSDSEDEDFHFEPEEEEYCSDDPITTDESDDGVPSAASFLQQEPGDYSGSTATVAILNKSKIYVANVGDSKCILSRQGNAIELSVDHNTSNPDELLRIRNAGGEVSANGYINHILNVSRSFGDFNLKGNSTVPSEQIVSVEPHIISVDIQKEDEYLIIASDGIWNCFTSQGLVDFINERLKTPNTILCDVLSDVLSLCLAPDLKNDMNGCDNMTLLCVRLNVEPNHVTFLVEEVMDVEDSERSNEEEKGNEEQHISEPSTNIAT